MKKTRYESPIENVELRGALWEAIDAVNALNQAKMPIAGIDGNGYPIPNYDDVAGMQRYHHVELLLETAVTATGANEDTPIISCRTEKPVWNAEFEKCVLEHGMQCTQEAKALLEA